MHIKNFEAFNYRNIEHASLSFEKGINLLYGENAQGKTNILEGIYTFARGKSFRGAGDVEQVRFGEKGFSLSLSFDDGERDRKLAYRYYEGVRKRYKDGSLVRARAEMLGAFRAVLFYPDHLNLVKGGPAERRLFLNIAISQISPPYLQLVARYGTVLENRNSLLKYAQKSGYLDRDQLEVWNESMAECCAHIALLRHQYILQLEKYACPVVEALSHGREKLSLLYHCEAQGEGMPFYKEPEECPEYPIFPCYYRGDEEEWKRTCDCYRHLLSSSLEREMGAGCSLFGIHRDDMEIGLNGVAARTFASQGQQRSAVLALKLAEGEVSREACGAYPVYLLDDVLSELDEERRAFLLSNMGERQLILTACDRGALSGRDAHVIEVKGGEYVPAYR